MPRKNKRERIVVDQREPWEICAPKGRIEIMPTKVHGDKSRRAERRKHNQRMKHNPSSWED